MNIKRVSLLLALVFLAVISAQAQYGKIRKGDKHFSFFRFEKAIQQYEKALKKSPENYHATSRIADAYRLTGRPEQAEEWYERVVALPESTPIQRFYYAQALRSNQKYEAAKAQYLQYASLDSTDSRGKKLADGIDRIPLIMADSSQYEIENLDINSGVSDFSPAYFGDSLVFVSARGDGKTDNWSGASFLDLYMSEKEDSSWGAPKPLPGLVNRQYHEGPLTFTADKKTMYFTRNNYIKRKKKKSKDNIMMLSVFESKAENDQWDDISRLPFDDKQFSIAHPTLSADGKKMYFSSDMPGGYGNTDLYVTEWTDSMWSNPVNLGPGINTAGKEEFPFIHKNGTLYFASDSYEGLGGLDIYKATQSNGKWGNVQNMGYLINSHADDFGLITSEDGETGYFSSNREGGKGDDDIYTFTLRPVTIEGLVVEVGMMKGNSKKRETDIRLPGAKVVIENLTTGEKDSTISGPEGEFSFVLPRGEKYKLTSEKESYFLNNELEISTVDAKPGSSQEAILEMFRILQDAIVELDNIYYDYDQFNIRPDAAKELDKLIELLKKYPDMEIEMRSHTDSRATDSYNLTLSQKRAQAAVEYMVGQGITAKRMTAKGYGETVPVNKCVNDVECTEEEHQQNRRTEFKVTKQPEGAKVQGTTK